MPPTNRKRPAVRAADQRNRLRRGKPKVCALCASKAEWVDYKDIALLRRFVSDRGKIKSRGNTGTCAQHQRDIATAIKTARELALLPYVVRMSAADKPGGRRGGPRPDRRGEDRGPAEDAAAEAEEVEEPTEEESAEALEAV